MASKIDVPVADESVDLTDPVGSAKTIALMAVGFAVLMIAFTFGQDLAQQVQTVVANVTGHEHGEGQRIEVV